MFQVLALHQSDGGGIGERPVRNSQVIKSGCGGGGEGGDGLEIFQPLSQ